MKKSALTTTISILLIVASVFALIAAGFGVKDGLAIKQYKEEDAKAADVVGDLEKAIGMLKENEAAYLEGVGTYAKGLSDYTAGQKAYNEGKAALAQGYKDYDEGKATLAQGYKDYAAGKKALEEGRAKVAAGQAMIDANTDAYNEGKALLAKIEPLMPLLNTYVKFRDGSIAKLPGFDSAQAWFVGKVAPIAERLGLSIPADVTDFPAYVQNMVAEGKAMLKQYEDGLKELEAGKAELAAGEQQLAEAEKQLAQGEKDLAAGKKALEAGESELAAGAKELADGAAQLEAGRNDEAGQLTEKIRRKPYSVVLFDEIEKAHPDVLNILLQILDDGRITDAQGRTVNFENTVIVMTTNAGSNRKGSAMGFGGTVNDMGRERALKALGEFLRPEFINRVDEIVYFNSLTEENFRSIAELMLEETRDAIAERGISMTWNTALIDYLVRKSYSVTYGARNLRRTIQKDVEDAIAQKIIDCRGENAGHISVSADDNGVVVEVGE